MRMRRKGGAILGLAATLGLAMAGGAHAADDAARCAETARNRAIITPFADIFYRQRDVRRAFMTYVAPGYIQHNPQVADGRAAAIATLTPLFSHPGGHLDVKQIVVDGDYAVIHLLGEPDPKMSPLAVFDMYRLKDGKIVEHWDALTPVPAHSANPHPMF